MNLARRIRIYPRLFEGIAIAAVALFTVLTLVLLEYKNVSDLRTEYAEQARLAGNKIERQLTYSLSSTYTLATLISSGGGDVSEFSRIADELLRANKGISCLQLAPDGIVSAVYPPGRNEQAIGHNLLEDPLRRQQALASMDNRSLTVAGPLELIQGGMAVIGRYPVFIPDGSKQDRFWGFAIALIELDDLLDAVELGALFPTEAAYTLSRIEPQQQKPQVFASSIAALPDDPLAVDITVPGGMWKLAVAPHDGWGAFYQRIDFYFVLGMATIISLLIHVIANQQASLSLSVMHDELTGLPSRALFMEQFHTALSQAQRNQHKLGLFFLDLDGFKGINDRYGHAVGDQVLKEIATRLRNTVRAGDLVARFGGDEFLVLATRVHTQQELAAMQKKLQAQGKYCVLGDLGSLDIGISVGACLYPDQGMDVETLVAKADIHMYRNKNGQLPIH